MRISASQIKTFELCERKWGLEKLLKWPGRGGSAATLFGSVLHAVNERYLLSDDMGRDEDGNVVDLFPEGWRDSRNTWTNELEGTVPEDQGAIIQALVKAAIEQRVLERRRHRKVEKEVNLTLLDKTKDLEAVNLIGYIDLAIYDPDLPEIQDHKTSKATRWLLNPEKLTRDDQMLIYAYAVLTELAKVGREPERIVLRHNQFVRDPRNMVVRKTQTTVSSAHVHAHWQGRILPIAGRMREVKAETKRLQDAGQVGWQSFKDPETEDPCWAYGGCPYQGVCFGRESEEEFKGRMRLINREKATTEVVTMGNSIKDKLAARRALRKGGGAKKAAEPTPMENPDEGATTAVEEAPQQDKPAAPWHVKGCRGCEEAQILGFSSAGRPCRICRVKGKDSGLPSPGDFEIYFKDGHVFWDDGMDQDSAAWVGDVSIEVRDKDVAPKTEEAEAPAEDPKPKAKAKKEESVVDGLTPKVPVEKIMEQATPEAEPAKAKAPKENTVKTPKEATEDDLTPKNLSQHVANTLGTERLLGLQSDVDRAMGKGRRGRKKHRLKLLVNCLPATLNGEKHYMLAPIIRELILSMEEASGVPFRMMDVWKRRDQLCVAAPVVAERLEGCWIVCSTDSQEEKEFVSALTQHATVVIRG